MKKALRFFALLMCAMVSFAANAQTDSKAALFVKGDLYFATLQSDANPRTEVSVSQDEAAAGAYAVLDFNAAENLFNIKSQNESKSFFVYKNGEAVENSEAGIQAEMFNAQTTLKDGDVVKVYSQKPYTTKMSIGFMKGTADQVEVVMDRVKSVSADGIVSVLEGTEFQIKATEDNQIEAVYYCNEDVEAVDGVYTVAADREGDAMIVIKMKEEVASGTASVKLTGRFLTFSAQNTESDDPRESELFSVNAEFGIDKTYEIAVVGEMKVRLVGQAEDNAIYVTVDGQPVPSTQENMYDAIVTLKPGSEVVVTNAEPSTGKAVAHINGTFYTFTAQNVNILDPRAAQIFSVEGEVDQTIEIPVNEEKTVRLVGQAENNAIYVSLDGQPVASTQENMFEATVVLKAGSVLKISNEAPATGIATVNINGTFYTFTGQDVNVYDPKAAELFSVTGEVDQKFEIAVDGEKTVRLVGQAENNAIYVTLDGQPVVSKQAEMFDAEVVLKDGSVLNITNAAPATGVATVNINGTFLTFTGQNSLLSDPKAAELFSVQGEVEMTKEIAVNGEMPVRLVGQAENNAIYVTLDGQKVASTQEYMFEAEVVLKAGSVLNITNAEPTTGVATVNINGTFYTFSGQDVNANDPRAAELFSVNGEVDQKFEIAVDEEKTVRLVGQAENNAIYVTLDGQQVVSTQENMFEAIVTLKAGSVLNITNAAPATGVATVNINGTFYTFSGQDVNAYDPKAAELFSVTGEVDQKIEIAVDEEKTVRLVGQAENNAIYVTLDGQQVVSTQENMFEAIVTLKAGSVLNITNAAPTTGVATVNINGTFYTFSGQDVNAYDPKAAELFSVTGEVDQKFEIAVDEEKTVRLVGQAENNAIYVTLNGQQVASKQADMFEAEVTIKAGDVINITNAAPSTGVATVNINGTFYTFSGQNVNAYDPKAAELFSVEGEVDSKYEIAVDDEMTVRLVGQAENNAIYVTLDGQQVVSSQENMFEATVTLKAGSVLNITNAAPATGVATVNINGTFYTFSGQDVNAYDPKAAELFSVSGEVDQKIEIAVDEEKTVRLVGQAENNAIYVTLNGQPVTSTQENMFEAIVTLKAGDVLDITNAAPTTGVATVNIKGNFYHFAGQDVDVYDPRAAELFSVKDAVDQKIEILVDGEKTVRLVGQAENNAIYVTLNGQPVSSEQADMFDATVTLKAGDVINITNTPASTGSATVKINGKFWNVTAQDVNVDDPRAAEVFSYQKENGETIEETITVNVDDSKTIRLIVQAENNSIHVTLDGEEVVSTQSELFEAIIVLKAGSVLEITDDLGTGINSIATVRNAKTYNLQGVEVKNPGKGLYIINGKKVLVK